LIKSEGREIILKKLVDYLLKKYESFFKTGFVPKGKNKDGYLADVIQFLSSVEA